MGPLVLLISVALALPGMPRAGTLGQSLAPSDFGTLEQNRENFYQLLSLICFARNNLFCNGRWGHLRGKIPMLHVVGHPAHPLEVLAEGTDILPVGAHRQVLSKLVVSLVFMVFSGLASTSCPLCYLQWWTSCHQTWRTLPRSVPCLTR